MADLGGAIVGHLVGDYLLQNQWLAVGKKSSSWICAIHCLIWSLCVAAGGGLPWWTLVPLAASHFVLDRGDMVARWMDLVGQREFRCGPCAPWSAIVIDNTMHLMCCWGVVRMLS